jgi:hypothetical protein
MSACRRRVGSRFRRRRWRHARDHEREQPIIISSGWCLSLPLTFPVTQLASPAAPSLRSCLEPLQTMCEGIVSALHKQPLVHICVVLCARTLCHATAAYPKEPTDRA